MIVDLTKVYFMSLLSGLGSNEATDFSVVVPSQNIAANNAVVYEASSTMANTDSIPDVQVRLTGIDSSWRWLDGLFVYSTATYSITVRTRFEDDTVRVRFYILNLTGGSISFPGFTGDCRAYLFDAPF